MAHTTSSDAEQGPVGRIFEMTVAKIHLEPGDLLWVRVASGSAHECAFLHDQMIREHPELDGHVIVAGDSIDPILLRFSQVPTPATPVRPYERIAHVPPPAVARSTPQWFPGDGSVPPSARGDVE